MDVHKNLVKKVLDWYATHKRDNLPWRNNISFYRVHVSEIMLQQTQVLRVVDFYTKWMERFPNYKSLAKADISEVYTLWKGLGYNSRAKRLWESAKILKDEKSFENIFQKFHKIPGVGPYTQSALETFIYNKKVPLIETNIRRVYIHEFFNDQAHHTIDDRELLILINITLNNIENPREWYYALMDYGSILPKIIKNNPNRKSKHYTKQSKFEGSVRQKRAKILFYLTAQQNKKITQQDILDEFVLDDDDSIFEALASLEKDRLIQITDFIQLI